MSDEFYRQCVLKRGTAQTTSWIPEKFAQKRRPVKLRQDDGSWEDGWVVASVGSRASAEQVQMYERSHTRTRKASDI
jgi:hypothetical protein